PTAVRVYLPPSTLAFNPPALPAAVRGDPYQFNFRPFASGGNVVGPDPNDRSYTFTKDIGAAFPPFGLILAPNGVLSGRPRLAGVYTFSVCAVDLSEDFVCQNVGLTIVEATATPTGTATPT